MIAGAESVRTTGVWELLIDGSGARLRRPATEAVLEIEDVDPRAIEAMVKRLDAGCSRDQALAELRHLGPQPEAILRELEEQQVLRRASLSSAIPVGGSGSLAEAVRHSVSHHRWRLEGPLFVFPAVSWATAAVEPRGLGVSLTWLHTALIATSGCPGCLVLRALGRMLARGQGAEAFSQTDPDVPRTLVAELLLEIEREPLGPEEGLWVGPGVIERGSIIAHPDCPRPHPGPDRSAPAMRAALRAPHPPLGVAAFEAASDRLLGSPFAPAQLHELTTGLDDLPFGAPFVWGDTRLVRHLGGRTRSVSIDGIIHGSGRTAEQCRRISICEAVERLAAQSARPDGWVTNPSGEALPVCHGLDLLHDQPCLVPFDRVVVGLSPDLLPELGRHEPAFTGAATHITLAQAIVNGTVEAIKRDAFMVAWYRRRSLCRIEWPRLEDAELAERTDFLRRRHFELELFDLTMDLPLPLLLLRVRAREHRKSWPAGGALLVPAGGFDPTEALGHALKLASMRVASLCHESALGLDPCDRDAVERTGREIPFWPPMARYLDPRSARAHAFLGTGGWTTLEQLPASSNEDASARLTRLRGWLARAEQAWTAVRITETAGAALGLEVVKVVMPGLMRLTVSRGDAALSSARLRMPLADATTDAPNDDPHPMY